MSDPSAKRQRLDSIGRFSPASPPFDVAAKASGQTTKTPQHPRTPTSPPYPSMSSHSNGGFMSSTTAATSDKSSSFHTASTAHSGSQSTAPAPVPYPIPTPASTTGMMSSTYMESDGDTMMEDGTEDDAERSGPHRRSNHNRRSESLFTDEGRLKASLGIAGDQLFKLSDKTYEASKPHASQNLFKLYDLESLASTVARTDPVTGEKINKLRKSYEGHIKNLQIAGKPKATKMDRVFADLLMFPGDDWHALHVTGKTISGALNPEQNTLADGFSHLFDEAFAGVAPGALPNPEAAKLRAYIGTDDTVKPKPQDSTAHRATPLPSAAPTPMPNAAHRGGARPERAGAKRQYTDAAFQGYGEGYGDDYADSTGGEDNGAMAKRRKIQFDQRTSHSAVEVGGVRR